MSLPQGDVSHSLTLQFATERAHVAELDTVA